MRNPSGIELLEEQSSVAPQVAKTFTCSMDTPDALRDREEWRLACRIAVSRGFNRSELLKRFLLDVCEQALLGRTREITEQRIGIRIFGRPAGYDSGEDNIVRNYARMLRKRLETYFAEDGAEEPLRLTIPRGGYMPVFVSAPGAKKPVVPAFSSIVAAREDETPPVVVLPVEEPQGCKNKMRLHERSVAFGLLTGFALALLIWAGARAIESHRQASAAHVLWAQMFANDRNTLIVPADSGLGILENLTHSQANVDAYISGSYFAAQAGLDRKNLNGLSSQRYTSMVVLGICMALQRLPEFTVDRTQIRYARSMTAEELRNSNVILLGSSHTDPWVALFDQRLNFRLAFTSEVDQSFVINQHPQGGERAIYRNDEADEHQHHTYGSVAYLPDAGGAGHVLIVQGLNMAATQAAADILFNASVIAPVLRQATSDNGKLHPFELLVETTSIGASASDAHIVASRVYP
jgi:hypothetical protein